MDPLTIQTHLRNLSGVGQLPETPAPRPTTLSVEKPAALDGPSFGETLGKYINEVNTEIQTADAGMADLAAGRSGDLHGTLIAMQKADIQLRLLVETRNKVIRAYEDIMRMQA
jgi:flagellar hook-basal body complex protein FliE